MTNYTDNKSDKTQKNLSSRNVKIYFLYSITFLLAIFVPIIGKLLLVKQEEREFETSIVSFFHNNSPSFILSASKVIAILFSTKCCIAILVLLALLSLYLHKNYKTTIVQLLISLLPMAYVFAIKFIVHRQRPNLVTELPPDPSFPSGHTAAAVAILTMIMLMVYLKKPLFIHFELLISAIVVIIVALSRLVVAAHFPTDVLTSAIIYPLLSTTIFYIFQKHNLYEFVEVKNINGSDILNQIEN